MRVYFSDIFNVKPNIIEKYGAFNISLVNDLPLFVDPFLLFNSKNTEYQNCIRKYSSTLHFSETVLLRIGQSWTTEKLVLFPEVKQTWLVIVKSATADADPE